MILMTNENSRSLDIFHCYAQPKSRFCPSLVCLKQLERSPNVFVGIYRVRQLGKMVLEGVFVGEKLQLY
jgi:hypothetical protein